MKYIKLVVFKVQGLVYINEDIEHEFQIKLYASWCAMSWWSLFQFFLLFLHFEIEYVIVILIVVITYNSYDWQFIGFQ